MRCPGCGEAIIEDQQYCRVCGAELNAGGTSNTARVRIAGLGVLALMFAGFSTVIFGKMLDVRWLTFLGMFVMITGIFIVPAYVLLVGTRPRKPALKQAAAPIKPVSIEKAATTSKLLPVTEADYIPSVVEDTTELLKTPVRKL